MDCHQWTPDSSDLNEKLVEQLKCPDFVKSIPFLNHYPLEKITDLSLVRFRGMIQDMMDPEIYLENYEVQTHEGQTRLQNGKFRDTLVINENEIFMQDSAHNKHGERRTMFVITIPALNSWAENVEKSLAEPKEAEREILSINKGTKRTLEQGESMETDAPKLVTDNLATKKLHTSKSGKEESKLMLSPEYLLNSPIADRPSKACMVKVYQDFDSFKLNTVVDIVGFLSVDPALDGTMYDADDFEEITEKQARNPPPSLIPRLHAVHVAQVHHLNPLLDSSSLDTTENIEDLRKDLELTLTQCLFGDKLAANVLMCHLVSSIYVRNDMNCLGQFSLNFSHIPRTVDPEYTKQLYEIIELLMPASHYLPMTLENMNTLQFVPKKDYQTNKLTSGLLQLAPHTHLIIDETRLQPGKLEAGVNAVANIAHLINTQKLKYNFHYYQIDFDTNIPILVMSEGKSMLPSNCHVPLQPDNESVGGIGETLKAANHFLQPKLNAIRVYLTKMRIEQFEMDTENSEMIQNDIVEIRREINASVDDLHQLLVLSRLIGLTYGKLKLDRETWDLAKEMHKGIKIRHELNKKDQNEI